MNNDIPAEVKRAIIEQERAGIQQQIYRLSTTVKGRRVSGYTEQEISPFTEDIERLIKLDDFFASELSALG